MTFTSDKPRSWFLFLGATALGLFVFVPIAIAGLNLRGIPFFLAGMAGAGVSFIVAAFVALYLASRVASGRYRDLRAACWRDQVWVVLLAIAAFPA